MSLPLPGAALPTDDVEVLPALSSSAPAPTTAGLTSTLGALLTRPALGRTVSAEIVDVATGTTLYARDATRAAVPASAAKVLTSAAALNALGPDTTLPTRTVLATSPGTSPNASPSASAPGGTATVALVGGGDVLLAPGYGNPDVVQGHAGLADLADVTAASLRVRGITTVTLTLDDTLFSGPAVNPAWLPGDVRGGFVAPVMALEVTVGVTRPGVAPQPGLPAPRLADPALSAARQFASLLTARGITLIGEPTRAKAPGQAPVLGEVRSAPVADVVELDLTDSDNTTAEALARLVAVAAGRPATFADGGRAVLGQIGLLGVPTSGARMAGGSGLGRGTVLPVSTVARTLALAGSPEFTHLRPVLTGLPVAGASGTLTDRFGASGSVGGAGVVRAKTGTLTGVGSLAGTVVDADGRLIAFAVVADSVPVMLPGRQALDAVASALVGCGCH